MSNAQLALDALSGYRAFWMPGSRQSGSSFRGYRGYLIWDGQTMRVYTPKGTDSSSSTVKLDDVLSGRYRAGNNRIYKEVAVPKWFAGHISTRRID